MTMYYFAYGSNMNHKQMEDRCPTSWKFTGKAVLKGYKFVYDGKSRTWDDGAVANMVESKDDEVWGGLFEITEYCLGSLDCHEGYHSKAYDRKTVRVEMDNGTAVNAWAYLRIAQMPGDPSARYQNTVLKGAKDCGLPDDYVENYIRMKK